MRTRDAVLQRMQEVHDALERLDNFESLTRSQTLHREQLQEEAGGLLTELETVERNMLVERAQKPNSTETGAFTPSAPQIMRRTNPWQGGTDDLRGRALGAIERCQRLPDRAREVATRNVESDEDKTNALAAYTLATSNPDYFRRLRSGSTTRSPACMAGRQSSAMRIARSASCRGR